MWCIYTAVLTRPLLGKNCTSFYLIGLTTIWPIVYRRLVTCWCYLWSMRRCFRGRWTYPQVSEIFHLVWRCCLLNKSTVTLFRLSIKIHIYIYFFLHIPISHFLYLSIYLSIYLICSYLSIYLILRGYEMKFISGCKMYYQTDLWSILSWQTG